MQHLQQNATLQGGKYKIERVLGQGGFGNTYVGINTVLEEKFAIKEFFMQGINGRDVATGSVTVSLDGNKPQFEGQLEKFKKEALRIRALNNPQIVKVYDLFEENGTAYYVMDFVDGENLAERLKWTGKPMTEQEVREILPQILDALKTVHDAGIWHLDLKPANIMLTKEGKVKLIDFGASKQLNAQKGGATTSTAISYTNGYAPREQMEQNYDKFGPWTDIYALGATLYTLLTNNLPPLPTDIDDDISEDKHLSLPFSSNVSDELKNLVVQLMHTHRMQRPQSVVDIQTLLDNPPNNRLIENEETILANPIKKEGPNDVDVKDPTRSKKSLWWGLAGGLFLLLIILFGFIYSSLNDNSKLERIDDNSDSIAVVDSHVVDNKQESNKTSIFDNHNYAYSGAFSNQRGTHPVKLSFKYANGIINECVYYNIEANKDIIMTGKIKDDKLEFYARDDNADFLMSFSLDKAPSTLYGRAYIGNKTMDVNLNLIRQIDTTDNIFENNQISQDYNWSGTYEASRDLGNTYGGTPITVDTYIELRKSSGNKYTGTISISGYQIDYPPAQIEGFVSENMIRVYFKGCNQNGMNSWDEICQKDTPLFALINENGKIDVQWFVPLCEAGIVTQNTKISKD